MSTTQVSIDELRSNLAEIISRVMYGGDQVVVKKYKRDAAVIISKTEYERLKNPTRRLSRNEWAKIIKTMELTKANIPPLTESEVDKTINEVITEVRREKRKSKK